MSKRHVFSTHEPVSVSERVVWVIRFTGQLGQSVKQQSYNMSASHSVTTEALLNSVSVSQHRDGEEDDEGNDLSLSLIFMLSLPSFGEGLHLFCSLDAQLGE